MSDIFNVPDGTANTINVMEMSEKIPALERMIESAKELGVDTRTMEKQLKLVKSLVTTIQENPESFPTQV